MRKLLYAVILALLFLAPVERVDVAKLLPIQAVAVYKEDGAVVLETDTQYKGRGDSAQSALEDLKKTTSAVVYLDTAEYLLVSEETLACVEEMKNYLKPSVKVCVWNAAGHVRDAAKYLEVHGKMTKLRDWDREKNSL